MKKWQFWSGTNFRLQNKCATGMQRTVEQRQELCDSFDGDRLNLDFSWRWSWSVHWLGSSHCENQCTKWILAKHQRWCWGDVKIHLSCGRLAMCSAGREYYWVVTKRRIIRRNYGIHIWIDLFESWLCPDLYLSSPYGRSSISHSSQMSLFAQNLVEFSHLPQI